MDEDDLPVASLCVTHLDSDKEASSDFKTQCREIATFQFCGFCMHFVDNNNAPGTSDSDRDKLPKIRPFLNALLLRFTEVDASSQNLSLDETPIMFKGRVQLRQFLPLKRSRFGLKGFIVADSATGYVLNTMIYTGKEGPAASKDLAMCEVLWLMEPFVDKGYRLYVDNWLSSVPLFFWS